MKTESKLQWLVWVVVFLAILNISTLTTVFFRKYRADRKVETIVPDRLPPDNFSGRFFRDRLNLDADQLDEFRRINPVFRQRARAITMDLGRIRREMHLELISEKSDTGKLNLLSDSVGILHSNLKRLSYLYYLDMKAICRPDQRQTLELIFRDAFLNDMPMRGPGPRPYGRQFGKKKE